jgi:hypothetical protein
MTGEKCKEKLKQGKDGWYRSTGRERRLEEV